MVKLAENLRLNAFRLDVHDVKGMMADGQKGGQGDSSRPGIMSDDGCDDPFPDIKLNPEMGRYPRKILQSVHSVCDQHG